MSLPTFGPTGLQNVHDDAPHGYAVVRLDYRVSRDELFAALVLGFTETDPDRDPALMTVEEVRGEVESTLAGHSFTEVWRVIEQLRDGSFSPWQADRLEGLRQAMGRAYPVASVPRCPAAHPEDPTPCDGPPVVTVLVTNTTGANGCEHHAARMLASLEGGRVYALPDAPAGAAIRVFKAAATIRPFVWVERGEGQ
ncbi:hypothetical protein [Streptomyces sp. NBC_00582]|uniref:hypothetical protein n=1 Tax=Streptomyces sp. NBC_00582 TaxID=2975783 RepID=UPI002E808E87|nr:hypothetical protein [Streptomyces sp. NBC_00582]WUB60453.1 hypothetical protein OG852_08675 [Streptomyces sp. NBC_00582]